MNRNSITKASLLIFSSYFSFSFFYSPRAIPLSWNNINLIVALSYPLRRYGITVFFLSISLNETIFRLEIPHVLNTKESEKKRRLIENSVLNWNRFVFDKKRLNWGNQTIRLLKAVTFVHRRVNSFVFTTIDPSEFHSREIPNRANNLQTPLSELITNHLQWKHEVFEHSVLSPITNNSNSKQSEHSFR